MSSIFVAGLDLGGSAGNPGNDYSALVVIEARGTSQRIETVERFPRLIPAETMPLAVCDVGHIERFPLGTPYQRIADMMGDRMQRMRAPRYLAIDKTGVGAGLVEMMAGLSPVPITITTGDKVTRVGEQEYHVPKRDLVSASQIVVQNHVMRIGKSLPNAELLTREMQNFRYKISAKGHDTYESWREKEHDDLVLALAIAIWTGQMIISMTAAEVISDYTEVRMENRISVV